MAVAFPVPPKSALAWLGDWPTMRNLVYVAGANGNGGGRRRRASNQEPDEKILTTRTLIQRRRPVRQTQKPLALHPMNLIAYRLA